MRGTEGPDTGVGMDPMTGAWFLDNSSRREIREPGFRLPFSQRNGPCSHNYLTKY